MAPFTPHITLGNLRLKEGENAEPVLTKLKSALRTVASFPVRCNRLALEPTNLFRCVFVLIDPSPSLLQLRQTLVDQVGAEDDLTPFTPHLSLVYAEPTLLNEMGRRATIEQLGRDLFQGFSFEGSQVVAVETSGHWDSWPELAVVPLSASASASASTSASASASPSCTSCGCASSKAKEEPNKEHKDSKSDKKETVDLSGHYPFIREANQLAAAAVAAGNHPFGSLLVVDGQVVLRAQNSVLTPKLDVTRHAELNLISEASSKLTQTQIDKAILYSSTEPCGMCAGAIYWAGVKTVVFSTAASTLKYISGDSLGSCQNVFKAGCRPNHHIEVIGPVLEEEGVKLHEPYWSAMYPSSK